MSTSDESLWIWGSPFYEPKESNSSVLLFNTAVYGYILYMASGLISDGSEYLLYIPSLQGIVGSIVLPVLGVVPDGMMTLCSGFSQDPATTVAGGVGVMAGSTIMLLTFPWFVAIYFGRVPIVNGVACYSNDVPSTKQQEEAPRAIVPDVSYDTAVFEALLQEPSKQQPPPMMIEEQDAVRRFESKSERVKKASCLCGTGVSFLPAISKNAKAMLVTTLTFFIIQVPAFQKERRDGVLFERGNMTELGEAAEERVYAQVGMGMTAVFFLGYMVMCYLDAQKTNDTVLESVIQGIKNRTVGIGAALAFAKGDIEKTETAAGRRSLAGLSTELLPEDLGKLQKLLRPFFARYDTDYSSTLEMNEFTMLVKDLGINCQANAAEEMFKSSDTDGNGSISFDEFTECLYTFLCDDNKLASLPERGQEYIPSYEIEDEEDEEIPEDFANLPEDEQRRRILFRALWMMGSGTLLVLVVSDPFVDLLTEWARRYDISPFYVAFVIAPFASNASELLAAYQYSIKKTQKHITTSVSTLVGAACMNNTFCLGIVFFLVWWQELAWQFTAETVSIVVVQWFIGLLAIFKRTHTMFTATLVLACYPLTIAMVWVLENRFGLD